MRMEDLTENSPFFRKSESVKINEDIPCVDTTCEYFDTKMPENCGGECGGEPALCSCVKYLKSCKIITTFIQQREAGELKDCFGCQCIECERCIRNSNIGDLYEPLPSTLEETK